MGFPPQAASERRCTIYRRSALNFPNDLLSVGRSSGAVNASGGCGNESQTMSISAGSFIEGIQGSLLPTAATTMPVLETLAGISTRTQSLHSPPLCASAGKTR